MTEQTSESQPMSQDIYDTLSTLLFKFQQVLSEKHFLEFQQLVSYYQMKQIDVQTFDVQYWALMIPYVLHDDFIQDCIRMKPESQAILSNYLSLRSRDERVNLLKSNSQIVLMLRHVASQQFMNKNLSQLEKKGHV